MTTMAVNAISTLTDNAAASVATKSKSLDKDAFLRLLTTQLHNQDPTAPNSRRSSPSSAPWSK
jgi:flagellar hook assembly protein FlgD